MAFLEDLGKKAKDIAGVTAEKAKDLAEAAAEKAKNASDAARQRMAIAAEQREIEKNYRAIGEWFVTEFRGEIPNAVRDVVDAVKASQTKIAELSARVEESAEEEADEQTENHGAQE